MKSILTFLALLITSSSALAADTKLTYVDLIKRATDLEYIATLPDPGESCAQWSSYDRASRYDAATGKYVKWDANNDGDGYIRKEGDGFVLAEMEGPGCIWRIWSASPGNGHIRIYLDGAAEPAVDLPFIGYFDGKNEPFNRKAFVHATANSGRNNHVPIPYAKSCKIVADKGWGMFYHFTYGTFPKGTIVPTFKRQLSAEESAALDAVDKTLSSCGPETVINRPGQATQTKSVAVAPGQSAVVATLAGPAAITDLRAKLDLPQSPADRLALRELVLKITWDDDSTPAIWCPLGDFFGTAAGANQYRSLPLGLTAEGTWYSHWYMPFAKAKIELINDGKEPRTVNFEIEHAPLTRPLDTLGRFHVKWHRDAFMPAEPERKIDWPMLVAQGRGRFVGVMLHVWNPVRGWWGEGDEKFFVDGEKFPSTFGTGSEDYFGYAWCSANLFQHAFHNQTIAQKLKGHISDNRWQIADNVPFQKSFEGDIEKYYPDTRPCLYSAVAYWYLAAGVQDSYQPVSVEDRANYWIANPGTPIPAVAGALEGEDLRILGHTAGPMGLDYDRGLSDGADLWWRGTKVGDKLDLALPVARAGQYTLMVQLVKARSYGIVQVYLDGKKLGDPVDCFSPTVASARAVTDAPVELAAGEHKLTFEIMGSHGKTGTEYLVGIDYIKLDAQK